MNTIDKKECQSLCSICCDTTITHDTCEEFTLPDYVNEVRRVLTTRAQVLPENQYVADTQSGVSLDFGGTVTYFVIYTDDEGKLCSTPLSSNYEASTALKSRPRELFIDTVADNVTTRVSAPRKLTIKTRLKSRILGFEEKEICDSISQKSSADELFIERLGVEVSSLSLCSGSLSGIKISERLDTGAFSSVRPVLCDASVVLTDVRASNGGISCHGELCVSCICENEGELVTLSRICPIHEDIEVEGACIGDSARANARCVSLSISSEECDGGVQLFFDASCEIEGECLRNRPVTLTRDAYSTKHPMDTKYRDVDVFSLIKASNGSFSVNESVKRKSKDLSEIVSVLLDPVCEKCDLKGERAFLSGRLCASVIGKSDNGEFACESYEIPIKNELDISAVSGDIISRASFGASLVSAKYSDDKLILNAELYPSVELFEKSTVSALDSATLKKDTEYKSDASSVRVYFPKNGDILWEIAKRYHTTSGKIAEQNSLDSDSLNGVKSIII